MMRLATILAGAAMSAVAVFGALTPAAAWDRDHAYADSFGNLVIQSAAGYKRIIVGEGHRAEKMSRYLAAGAENDPVTIFADRDDVAVFGNCYRPPVLVKGRSYMYGFDQGEIPLQGGPCR
jgi:hypothetical protein